MIKSDKLNLLLEEYSASKLLKEVIVKASKFTFQHLKIAKTIAEELYGEDNFEHKDVVDIYYAMFGESATVASDNLLEKNPETVSSTIENQLLKLVQNKKVPLGN